ncbi:hypothetical protein [Marinobacter sp.]|uniref:hypothetical protein n=1 Tax=Marinobacter sp. TaxID=50741 RepID=UPI003A900867
MTCKHCQAGVPVQHGVHMGELEMHKCERELALVPKEQTPRVREAWYQPSARKDLPFTCGGKP